MCALFQGELLIRHHDIFPSVVTWTYTNTNTYIQIHVHIHTNTHTHTTVRDGCIIVLMQAEPPANGDGAPHLGSIDVDREAD